MRRLLKAGMMLFLVGALQVSSFASQNIQVKVNNSTLQLQNELVVRDGNVYISVRDIGEALGYEFSWSKDNKTANLKSEDLIIALQPNNRWFSKKKRDGSVATFQFGAKEAPIMVNNTMYVPLGNFTRVAEGRIDWDSNKGVYNIIYGEKLDYVSKAHLNLYAGNGKKGALDGPVKESQFAFAQSICFGKNKEIYVSDSGRIRKIKKTLTGGILLYKVPVFYPPHIIL